MNDQIALDVQEVQTVDVEGEQAMKERDTNILVVLVSGRVLGTETWSNPDDVVKGPSWSWSALHGYTANPSSTSSLRTLSRVV